MTVQNTTVTVTDANNCSKLHMICVRDLCGPTKLLRKRAAGKVNDVVDRFRVVSRSFRSIQLLILPRPAFEQAWEGAKHTLNHLYLNMTDDVISKYLQGNGNVFVPSNIWVTYKE